MPLIHSFIYAPKWKCQALSEVSRPEQWTRDAAPSIMAYAPAGGQGGAQAAQE